MRKILILLAGASLFLGAACSDDDPVSSADSYDDFEGDFTSQCATAAAGAPDAEGLCQCAFDNIKENVPLDELKAFNEELEDTPAAEPPAGITDAITECAGAQVTTP